MRIFKTIISGILSLTLCSGMASLTVGAVGNNYYKGDVNSDGVVNTSDLVAMVSFLEGQKSATGSDAERLDLNRNYIIDNLDLELLKSILLEDVSTEVVTSVNTAPLPNETSVRYRIYDPVYGMVKRTYTINPNTSTVSGTTNARGLIYGEDTRAPQDGMQGVLNVQWSWGENLGTAFVVDSHTILTAAHVLYLYEQHVIIPGLKFKVFDQYNVATDVVITPKSYHIPDNFCDSPDSDSDGKYDYISEWDYAIVTVEEDLSEYINFDIGMMRSGNMNQQVYVTGFGGAGDEDLDSPYVSQHLIGTKSTGVGYLMEDNPYNNYFICYDTDMVGGDSGGPVWVQDMATGTRTVIGINIFTNIQKDANGNPIENLYNAGYRINTNILHAIFNNDYYLSL